MPVTSMDRLLTFFGVEYQSKEELQNEVFPLGTAPFLRLPACNQYGEQAQHACDERTAHCDDRTMPGWGQGLDASAAYRDDMAQRAENAPWIALAVFVSATALFYAVRWALTGRLRPLWLLRRRKG